MILTAGEIITNVSSKGLDSDLILDAYIISAENKYFSNFFGRKFYNAVVNDSGDNYDDFIDLLKPSLSFYTMYNCFWNIHVETGDRGNFTLAGQNQQTIDLATAKEKRNSFLDTANELMISVLDYIYTQIESSNTYFTNYFTDTDIDNFYKLFTKVTIKSNAKHNTQII